MMHKTCSMATFGIGIGSIGQVRFNAKQMCRLQGCARPFVRWVFFCGVREMRGEERGEKACAFQ